MGRRVSIVVLLVIILCNLISITLATPSAFDASPPPSTLLPPPLSRSPPRPGRRSSVLIVLDIAVLLLRRLSVRVAVQGQSYGLQLLRCCVDAAVTPECLVFGFLSRGSIRDAVLVHMWDRCLSPWKRLCLFQFSVAFSFRLVACCLPSGYIRRVLKCTWFVGIWSPEETTWGWVGIRRWFNGVEGTLEWMREREREREKVEGDDDGFPEAAIQGPMGAIQAPKGAIQGPKGAIQVPKGVIQAMEGSIWAMEGAIQAKETAFGLGRCSIDP
ncbi:hypothetical protein Acr_07g0013470 [Actinidia rufa]|uniref:Uncharacterized protein n=1 Tax=Actinidia rufa TaxID=165716 RepID=A0A7J0EXE6_9ERIC|nr:hypothetical protein Acr_07g0013470 [Actinidia rufa]